MQTQQPFSTRLLKALHSTLPSLSRLLLTFLLLSLFCIISLLVIATPPIEYNYNSMQINYSNPFHPASVYQPFDKDFNYTVLMDVHSHTDIGGGLLDPETVIQWHIANGYNAIAITDHNEIYRAFDTQKLAREKYNDQIKVLVGEEWSNCRVHMGFIGITTLIDKYPKYPSDEYIQQVIQNVHAQGGIVTVNHKPWSYWSGLDTPSYDDLVDWGVDYFDVTTQSIFDLQTLYYARSKGVGIVAGVDLHELIQANEWTLLYVDPNNITEESILDALKTRNTSIIFDVIGHNAPTKSTQPSTNMIYTFLYAWIVLGNLVRSYYWFDNAGAYSFVEGSCGNKVLKIEWAKLWTSVFWVVFLWLVFEVIFAVGRFVWKKIMLKYHPEREFHDDDMLEGTPLMNPNVWKK